MLIVELIFVNGGVSIMKKMISVLLIAVMVLSLCGCAEGQNAEEIMSNLIDQAQETIGAIAENMDQTAKQDKNSASTETGEQSADESTATVETASTPAGTPSSGSKSSGSTNTGNKSTGGSSYVARLNDVEFPYSLSDGFDKFFDYDEYFGFDLTTNDKGEIVLYEVCNDMKEVNREPFIEEIVVPYGVQVIGEACCEYNTNIRRIILPDTVTYIGDNAFKDCSNLEYINIPDGVTYIGRSAFRCCSKVDFTMPKAIEEIAMGAFCKCKEGAFLDAVYEKWPLAVEVFEPDRYELGDDFHPDGYEEDWDDDWDDWDDWDDDDEESYYFDFDPDYNYGYSEEMARIDDKIFYRDEHAGWEQYWDIWTDTGMKIAKRGNEVVLEEVVTSGASDTYDSKFTVLVIPEGVTMISDHLFNCHSELMRVVLPSSLKIIANNAFDNCSGLESIYLPDGVKKIEDEAFHNCRSLRVINIPGNLTEVGVGAFYGDLELCCREEIFEEWPKAFKDIYDDWFDDEDFEARYNNAHRSSSEK